MPVVVILRRSVGGGMRVIGLAGWSGAGKTTLLRRLIPVLTGRGRRVSTIKQAHHGFEIDRPGKDSWLHREAGAAEVLIASPLRWALMRELGGEPPPTLPELIARLFQADIVIVEGFKAEAHPRIEVFRAGNGKPPLHPGDPGIVAVASDVSLPDAGRPVVALDDVDAIAGLVEANAVSPDTIAWRHIRHEARPKG
jgi:molybdopterin-guanine dinucleotide biosynthesis adapter protein